MENLCDIIYEGNLERAKELINLGYDINGKYGEMKFYPIYSAMNSIDPVLALKFVIDNGADVNIEYGLPLSIAFGSLIDGMTQNNRTEPFEEDIEMIKILIKKGANLTIKDKNGLTPFSSISDYSVSEKRFYELRDIFVKIIPDFDKYLQWDSQKRFH